jgi:NAD(P)-dependent dehydrogenase (short-subunit alcohol dehydrogenase family)
VKRLEGKRAVVVGAGQTPGDTVGNGKAMALLFAREGASVLCVDRDEERAEDTAEQIVEEGGVAAVLRADVTRAEECASIAAVGRERWGGIDILVNNVGIGVGDAPPHKIDEEAWDRILDVNLKGMAMTVRHVLPVMREQGGGSIVNISSLASIAGHDLIAYEVSKAGVNRLTVAVASGNAKYGVRCNAILPGLMDTPMAIVGISRARGVDPEELRAARNARVPLGRMGSGWDTAWAALYLASDEARFVTGVCLPVDGGMSTRIG